MSRTDSPTFAETIRSLWQLLVDYARQETLGPLKGLGRTIGFGVGGAVLVSIGVVLLALAGLRVLQSETGTALTGNLSWIPYLIVVAGLGAVAALAVRAIIGGSRSSR